MTRSNPFELFVKDLEIEQIALQNLIARIKQRVEELGVELEDVQSQNMVELQRTMFKSAKPSPTGVESSIVRSTIVANNFEIKPNIIQLV